MFVSGIDPGWALDILPALVSGVGAGIEEIRIQELFNYALYDQPAVVREVIGFGGPMDELPLMLLDFSLDMVWAPMLRVLADLLDVAARRDHDPRRAPAARAHDRGARDGHLRGGDAGGVPLRGPGHGRRSSAARRRARDPHRRRLRAGLAAVHARPAASTRSCMTGHPNLEVSVHGTEPGEPGAAGGGNASAANRIVNAIPAVCAARARRVEPARPAADHRRAPAPVARGAQVPHLMPDTLGLKRLAEEHLHPHLAGRAPG